MSLGHFKYGPVGYDFNADHYCGDCIVKVIMRPGKGNGGNGCRGGECNCAECRLDRIAKSRGIDRQDDSSFDSSDFPKIIPYHNNLHADCGDSDREAGDVVCYGRCASCHEVIDGASHLDGPDTCPTCDDILEPLIRDAETRVWDVSDDAPDYATWKRSQPEGATLADYEGEFTSTEVRGQGKLFNAGTCGGQ
jgi:hypothetical protein